MLFNSFQFLWLFPIIFLIYWTLASMLKVNVWTMHKIGNIALLVIPYGLYMQLKPAFALLLLGVTAVTFGGKLILGRGQNSKRKWLIFNFQYLYFFLCSSLSTTISSMIPSWIKQSILTEVNGYALYVCLVRNMYSSLVVSELGNRVCFDVAVRIGFQAS